MQGVKQLQRIIGKLFARKLTRVATALAVVLIPAIAVLSSWSNSPSSTPITITPPHESRHVTAPYQSLKTPYFTSQLPGTWHIKPSHRSGSRYEQTAYAPNGSNGQVGFTSDVIPSDGLRGIGDYNLRLSDTTNYRLLTDPAVPSDTELFENRSVDSGYTAFMTRSGRYVAVSITGMGSEAANHDLLVHIITAWQWSE